MNTRRRCLAAGAVWPALVWTGALHAQPNAPLVIGFLSLHERHANVALVEAMAALGWKLGVHYRLEARYAEGFADRLPALAQELAALKPALVIAVPSSSARAMAAAAPATPIVLAPGDPIASGLVTNLARPGGMITGLSSVAGELNGKLLELVVEALPKIRRVGILADSTIRAHAAYMSNVRGTAERLGVAAHIAELAKPEDIEGAVARLVRDKVQALVISSNAWLWPHLPKIMALATAQRWPVVGTSPSVPKQGGLLSYGASAGRAKRVAYYVDRILKGAKPGDLPIEQPTTFDMVLNMKTAKLLGITIPPSMLVRATEVIE
jgi:putative tryptophan/tyrosine transport system substrate-binding protein